MSKTLNEESCDACGSKDNMKTWEYNGKVITMCKTPGCGAKNNSSNSTSALTSREEFNASSEPITGEYKATRGLTEETCRAVGILCQDDHHIFLYKDAQKVRFPKPNGKKGMYWQGYHEEVGLFGEHLNYDYEKEIVITEGEFDMGSVYQAGYQAYSIGLGAQEGGGAKEIQEKIELLSRFKEIILWFDNDKAGKAFLKQVLNIPEFPLHKLKVVINMDDKLKDANDYLIFEQLNEGLPNSEQLTINYLIGAAQEYRPKGLIRGDEIDFKELKVPLAKGLPYCFSKMEDYYHGLHESEVLLIGGGSGSGKSCFAKRISLNWVKELDVKIAFLFLEENQQFTIKSLLTDIYKKPSWELEENPPEDIDVQAKNRFGSNRFYFESHFGSLESKEFIKKLTFLAHKVGVIILDHISIVVSGMSSIEGERKDIDIMMTAIKTLSVKTKCRFVIISHLRRPQGEKSYEDGLPITSNSFRGSGSLYQLSNSAMGLERNQQSEGKEKNKLLIRGLKNRFKGDSGVLDSPYYDSETGSLDTLDNLLE